MDNELKKAQYELKKLQAMKGKVSDFGAYNAKLVEAVKRNNFLVEEGRKNRRDADIAREESAKIKDYFGTDPRLRDRWGK